MRGADGELVLRIRGTSVLFDRELHEDGVARGPHGTSGVRGVGDEVHGRRHEGMHAAVCVGSL